MSLDFAKLRETRAAHPEKLAEIYASRNRRDVIQGDGRLFIVAADHPARNAVAVRDNPRAMANRYDLIERLATALDRKSVV